MKISYYHLKNKNVKCYCRTFQTFEYFFSIFNKLTSIIYDTFINSDQTPYKIYKIVNLKCLI